MERQYIGARYVPIFYQGNNGAEWESGVAYDPLTIVTYNSNSYTSRIPVPSGVGNPQDNPNYWVNTGNFNAQVEQYRQDIQNFYNSVLSSLDNNYLPVNFVQTRYNSQYTGNSTVYYVIIPAQYKPVSKIAQDKIATVQYPAEFLIGSAPTVMINGATGSTQGIADGPIIIDGVVRQENNLYGLTTEKYVLYMTSAGTLISEPAGGVTAAQLLQKGAVWAICAWWPIIEGGAYVAQAHLDNGAQPMSCIGQLINGDYIVLCCDGRTNYSHGMSPKDMYDFCQSQNLNVKFLYNLDGGGSSALYLNAKRMNGYQNRELRKLINVLMFESQETPKLNSMQTIEASSDYQNYQNEIKTYFDALNVFNFNFENWGINGIAANLRSQGTGGAPYQYNRIFKISHDVTKNQFTIELDNGLGTLAVEAVNLNYQTKTAKFFGNTFKGSYGNGATYTIGNVRMPVLLTTNPTSGNTTITFTIWLDTETYTPVNQITTNAALITIYTETKAPIFDTVSFHGLSTNGDNAITLIGTMSKKVDFASDVPAMMMGNLTITFGSAS